MDWRTLWILTNELLHCGHELIWGGDHDIESETDEPTQKNTIW